LKQTSLDRKLKLHFKDRKLLDQAFVHPSYLNELQPDKRPAGSYERLEFLGDAILGAAVTMELFKRCPELPEGQLTKLRSSLVDGRTLAGIARKLELGQYLKLGKGEESTGGRDRASNLAATLEALIAAVFLDRGFDKARKFALRIVSEEMEKLLGEGVPEDPKSYLQEVVQGMGGGPPHYRLVEAGGPDHARSFEVEVLMAGQVMGRGQGGRKLDAERQAAQEALRRLDAIAGR
jgi:ribonuclease-3